MAENSGIEWTTHTFNPWIGCTKVSPACDHCYAEDWDKRYNGGTHWGPKAERRRTKTWGQPIKWNREAAALGVRPRVFCASLADVFDNKVPPEWREDLWALIRSTPNLDWLLLTKRPQNIAKMLPEDWGQGYENVWLGTTAENQEEYDRRAVHFFAIPAVVHFLSMEPLLGAVDVRLFGGIMGGPAMAPIGKRHRLNWVICGGESGPNARPMHPDWALSLRDQCEESDVPFFFKQWGEWAPGECATEGPTRTENTATFFDGTWLYDRITPRASREMHRDDEPDLYCLGKKAAGRTLDGAVWDQYPDVVSA